MKNFKVRRMGLEVVPTFKTLPFGNASCQGCPPEFETVNLPRFLNYLWWRICSIFFIFGWSKGHQELHVLWFWFRHQDYLPMNYALLRIGVRNTMIGWKRPASFWYEDGQKKLPWKLEIISLFKWRVWTFRDVGTSYCGNKPSELGV